MPAALDSKLPYQTANYFLKTFGIRPLRLQTAALKGFIRTKVQDREWAPCLFNVEDVKKFVRKRTTNQMHSRQELRQAQAGN